MNTYNVVNAMILMKLSIKMLVKSLMNVWCVYYVHDRFDFETSISCYCSKLMAG